MGERGRQYVERELTWPRLVESWLDQLMDADRLIDVRHRGVVRRLHRS